MQLLSIVNYVYVDSYCTRYHVKTMNTQTQHNYSHNSIYMYLEPQFKIAVRKKV